MDMKKQSGRCWNRTVPQFNLTWSSGRGVRNKAGRKLERSMGNKRRGAPRKPKPVNIGGHGCRRNRFQTHHCISMSLFNPFVFEDTIRDLSSFIDNVGVFKIPLHEIQYLWTVHGASVLLQWLLNKSKNNRWHVCNVIDEDVIPLFLWNPSSIGTLLTHVRFVSTFFS